MNRRKGQPKNPSGIMTPRQALFVKEYLVDLNAAAAAVRAGYSSKSVDSTAARLMAKAHIKAAVDAEMARRAEKIGIDANQVLERFVLIAFADPRELVEYRRTCCRYCHGLNHDYQSTPREMARDKAKWEESQTKKSKDTFDERGGSGYNRTLAPHPQCPECFGEGEQAVFLHDTRKLSDGALALYAGVKETKDGVEVKMQDRNSALVKVGEHLGMFQNKEPAGDDPAEIARKVREALRAMADADGLRVA